MAGAATAFWTVAGACLGATGRGRGRDLSPLRWVLAGNALVVTAAAVAVFWWPVYRRTTLTEAAMAAWANHDAAATAEVAERAARSDPLDGFAAADAARAAMAGVGGEDWTSASAVLTAARGWADQATRRDPAYYGHFTLASDLAWLLAARDNYTYCWEMLPSAIHGEEVPMDQRVVALAAMAKHAYEGGHYSGAVALLERAVQRDPESAMLQGYLGDAAWMAGQVQAAQAAWRRADELAPRGGAVDDALACLARAAQRNPTDSRLRLTAAAMYARAARPADCNTELDAAERLDAALNPESLLHFDAAEQAQVRLLRARAAIPAAPGGT
jgi:tetratricopeptide (TPR) repeat protein